MVVKSATKKRLMELGVSEELAHKLATDRNMNDIKALTSDEIAVALGVSKEDDAFQLTMDVLGEIGARRKKRRSKKITIRSSAIDDDDMPLSNIKFNVLNHEIVPHQELVAIEDEESALEPWNLFEIDDETGEPRLAKELLPKILITDPVIQVIKEAVEKEDMAKAAEDPDHLPISAGWLADRVLRVVRKSPSAGVSEAYRLIVEGS